MYNIGNQGKIMRKLLGKPTVESSNDTSIGITSSPVTPQSYRPIALQNAVYAAGLPIRCLDRSPDGRTAILAGPHILKTVNFEGLSIKEGLDLRALISMQGSSTTGTSSSTSDQLAIRDVKWSSGQGSPSNATVFTACANGKIFQYDLTRAGSTAAGIVELDFVQIHEDTRQINTLDINQHLTNYLLSGSQDGVARCFDIRAPIQTRAGLTFPLRYAHPYKCNDSVRQVKWSTGNGLQFACSTDQGLVLKWDVRKALGPLLRIKAHDKMCSSIAWHPDKTHLISAGWDSKCCVWDMSDDANKKQKPKWTISTPAPASVVLWRPSQWSATAQGRRSAQVAISYDDSSQKRHGISSVHIWDLARPTMPYKVIKRFNSVPSAMLWHDQDLLWTVGQDGLFNQCDVAFAPKSIDRHSMSTMAFSATGDVLMFLDERAPSHRPLPHSMHQQILSSSSYSSSPTTQTQSLSRSDSEEDVVGSFLGPRRKGGGGSRLRRTGSRSQQALSTTPPTGGGGDDKLLALDEAINVTGIFRSQQSMAIGHIPAAANKDVYEYLSVNYLEALYRELPSAGGDRTLLDRVLSVLEHYARAAESVSQFRLAQTWRILGHCMNLLLKRRAQYHLELRLERLKKPPKKEETWPDINQGEHGIKPSTSVAGEETPRKGGSSTSLDKSRSLLAQEIESTSNVPTPLARPLREDGLENSGQGGFLYTPGKKLTPILEPDSFTLPPALQSVPGMPRSRLDSAPISVVSQESESTQFSQASTEGYDFYDTDALARAIDVPHPRRIQDHVGPASLPSGRKQVTRHDSEESYGQMFSISNGSRHTPELVGSSSHRNRASSLSGQMTRLSGGQLNDGEFGSRIRGREIEGMTPPSQRGALLPMVNRTETGFTSYTDEHHIITQTTSDSFASELDAFPTQTDATFSPDSPERVRRPAPPRGTGPFSLELDRAPYILETDYLHWRDDAPYPYPVKLDDHFSRNLSPPIQPYTIVSRALSFEVRSSALNAAAMVLLLQPLVPDHVIDSYQATAILRQHHSRLMTMKLFVEAALLRKVCMRGWPGGQLSSWGFDYPGVFTAAQEGVKAGFLCSSCERPREVDRSAGSTASAWRCERCLAVMAGCAVCGHRDEAPGLLSSTTDDGDGDGEDDRPVMSTWWHCPGCGHGGHSSCLSAWHSPPPVALPSSPPDITAYHAELSDGCCPADGCGHACLPGRWRLESAALRTEEIGRRAAAGLGMVLGSSGSGSGNGSVERSGAGDGLPSVVRGDTLEAVPSRAVDHVRETLASQQREREAAAAAAAQESSPASISSRAAGGGGGSSTGPKAGGERERRKSVKFVAADDRRRGQGPTSSWE